MSHGDRLKFQIIKMRPLKAIENINDRYFVELFINTLNGAENNQSGTTVKRLNEKCCSSQHFYQFFSLSLNLTKTNKLAAN